MAEKDTQARLDAIALRTAEINLERAEQEAGDYEARKRQKSRNNAQRQSQLVTTLRGDQKLSHRCNHRQGGTPKNPYKGNGDTALKVIKQPDGFTTLILCVICKLRCFSPHPNNRGKKVKPGENAEKAKARVAKYEADLVAFNLLLEKSEDSISSDFTQPMDCGITIERTDEETGNPIYGARPCDSYAQAHV